MTFQACTFWIYFGRLLGYVLWRTFSFELFVINLFLPIWSTSIILLFSIIYVILCSLNKQIDVLSWESRIVCNFWPRQFPPRFLFPFFGFSFVIKLAYIHYLKTYSWIMFMLLFFCPFVLFWTKSHRKGGVMPWSERSFTNNLAFMHHQYVLSFLVPWIQAIAQWMLVPCIINLNFFLSSAYGGIRSMTFHMGRKCSCHISYS